jgi:hypothetical protein
MNTIRYPLGSIPGIATVVMCALVADSVMHCHVPLHAFDRMVRVIEDHR